MELGAKTTTPVGAQCPQAAKEPASLGRHVLAATLSPAALVPSRKGSAGTCTGTKQGECHTQPAAILPTPGLSTSPMGPLSDRQASALP